MGLARYMTGKSLGRESRRMAILYVPIDKPPKQVSNIFTHDDIMDIGSIKNTVIQGDCLEILTTIPDNSIDAIVTDPPYEL